METFFTNLFNNHPVAMTFIIAVASAAVICTLAQQWRYARIAALEANLKRQMLDKGLSPGEIQQVLHASQLAGMDGDVVFTGQADADKAALVKLMTEYSYSGGDIARVLSAFAWPGQTPNPATVAGCAKAIQAMVEHEKPAGEIEEMLRAFDARESSSRREGIQTSRN